MAEPSYLYRPHVLSSERLYRLQPDELVWSQDHRRGRVAYGDVVQIRIFKARFFGSSATYWNCILFPRAGGKIKLGAATRIGFRAIEDRTDSYMLFVKDMEARIAAANPKLRVITGRHWLNKLEAVAGRLLVLLYRGLRRCNLARSANVAAWAMRKIGPKLRGHRAAAAQIAIAYPEKSASEIERILSGMWDNLGRVAIEYAHLDRIWDFDLDRPGTGRIELDEATIERCRRLMNRRGPVMMFGAHIGNWEVAAMAARLFTRDVTFIYKAQKIGAVADEMAKLRSSSGATLHSADATTTLKIRDALKRGHIVGMLVDQYYADGIDVTMFNRSCKVNPLFARFVRIFDCPFYGSHVIRLPQGRFRLEMTDAIEPRRDAAGRVDVAGTMQEIMAVVEGWVRKHPEQWMWLQRHWR